jgi:hypothetical protein
MRERVVARVARGEDGSARDYFRDLILRMTSAR